MFVGRSAGEPLLSFAEVQSVLRSHSYAFKGQQDIELCAVVGSESKSQDFPRDFRPQAHHLERLRRLAQTDDSQPIEVFRVDQVYFVRDGHHRVALARARGDATISALVTEVTVRAAITPDQDHDEVLRQAGLSHFLQETDLDAHCPESDFRLNQPELYAHLREHIEVHRYYLGREYNRPFGLKEAAASWHDQIYRPLLRVIEDCGVAREFPRRTAAELYLWLTYHREEMRCRGQWPSDEEVAHGLVSSFSERPWHGLVKKARRVWRAAWRAAQEHPEPPTK